MLHQPAKTTACERVPTARALPLVVLGTFVWFAFTAWIRPFNLPDEGRYAGVAWEMLWSGSWLVPKLDTLPYFHKPPLFYWITLGAFQVFGVNEWSARVPSLIGASAGALAIYLFLRRWADAQVARATLLILATIPLYFGGAQFANMDMLVAGCITCTILCAADALLCLRHGQPYKAALISAYLFAGLGVLSKGLIGAVIPGTVVLAWVIQQRRPADILRLLSIPGLVLFAVLVVPWFAVVEAKHPGFLEYFIWHHHFQRFASQRFNNQWPFWFYVPVFAGFTLPWSVFLPFALRRRQAHDGAGLQGDLMALMLIWHLSVIAFFSIPSSKLIGYVMPAVPPFAVLVAHAFVSRGGSLLHGLLTVRRVAAVAALVCVGLVGAAMIKERDNIAVLAGELRARVGPHDDVVLVRGYPFSLQFYLRHQAPMAVLEDWDAAEVRTRDSWRREILEAAKFDPERGRSVQLRPADLTRALCTGRTVWVFSDAGHPRRLPQLDQLEQVARRGGNIAWRSTPASPLCARSGAGP
jgi:4-amino-4-deoxy-L-arabinose transferase-like glycosyltransferase